MITRNAMEVSYFSCLYSFSPCFIPYQGLFMGARGYSTTSEGGEESPVDRSENVFSVSSSENEENSPDTAVLSIPQSASALYIALLRIAQAVAKKYYDKGSPNAPTTSPHERGGARASGVTEPLYSALSRSIVDNYGAGEARHSFEEQDMKRKMMNGTIWTNDRQHFGSHPSRQSRVSKQMVSPEKGESTTVASLPSCVAKDECDSSPSFTFVSLHPKDLLQRLLLQHRRQVKPKELHSSRPPCDGQDVHLSDHDVACSTPRRIPVYPPPLLYVGTSPQEETNVSVEKGKEEHKKLQERAKKSVDHKDKRETQEVVPCASSFSPSSSLWLSTWYQENTIPLVHASSSAMKAFYLFTEAVCRQGVIPTNKHFNILLVLAMAEMNWKLVDRIEQLHIGLLAAISERQEAVQKMLFAEEIEKEPGIHASTPYTEDTLDSLLEGEEKEKAIGSRDETALLDLRKHAQWEQGPPSGSGDVAAVEDAQPTVTSSSITGSSLPPLHASLRSPPPSHAISQLRASLYEIEMAMSPNTATLELLMEAQRCRVFMVHHTLNVCSSSPSSFSISTSCTSSISSELSPTRSIPSSGGHDDCMKQTVREGAAWAVIDLLDIWQSTGVSLTERGLWMVMEAYDILQTRRMSSSFFDVEEMWIQKRFQEAEHGDCGKHTPVASGAIPVAGSSSSSITLREAREQYYGGKAEWQRQAIRHGAVAEGMISDQLSASVVSRHPLSSATAFSGIIPTSLEVTSGWEKADVEESPVWKVAYTVFTSFYRQKDFRESSSIFSIAPTAETKAFSSSLDTRAYPHLHPLVLLLKGVTALPSSSSSFSALASPFKGDPWSTSGDASLSFSPSSLSRPSVHPEGISYETGWKTVIPMIPISFLALYHVLRVLYDAGQYQLVIQEYIAYERRVLSSDGVVGEKGWWWKRGRRPVKGEDEEDSEEESLPFLRWEAVGVRPEPSASSYSRNRPDGYALPLSSSTGYKHKGWEVWLLVMLSARQNGDWKVSRHVWMSAFTQAVVEAAMCAEVAPSQETLDLLCSFPPPADHFFSSSSLRMANTVQPTATGAETSSSSLLQAEAVPRWMRPYLPLFLQSHLHTLRRVGKYASLIRFYRKLLVDIGSPWNSSKDEKSFPLPFHPTPSSLHGPNSSWMWTPRSLLLVAQAAVVTQKEGLLLSLCGISREDRKGSFAPSQDEAAFSSPRREGNERNLWKGGKEGLSLFSVHTSPLHSVMGEHLWGAVGNREPVDGLASHAFCPTLLSYHRFSPLQMDTRGKTTRNDANGLEWKEISMEVFSLTLDLLHHQALRLRSTLRTGSLHRTPGRLDPQEEDQVAVEIQKKELLSWHVYETFWMNPSILSERYKVDVVNAKKNPKTRSTITFWRYYAQLMDIFYEVDGKGSECCTRGWPCSRNAAQQSTSQRRSEQLFEAAESVYVIVQGIMERAPGASSLFEPHHLLSQLLLFELLYRCRAFAIQVSATLSTCFSPGVVLETTTLWRGRNEKEHEKPWVYPSRLAGLPGVNENRTMQTGSSALAAEADGKLYTILQKIEREAALLLTRLLNTAFASEVTPKEEKVQRRCEAMSPSPTSSSVSEVKRELYSLTVSHLAVKMGCGALLLSSPAFRGHSEVVMAILEKAGRDAFFTPLEVRRLTEFAREVASAQVKADYFSSLHPVEKKEEEKEKLISLKRSDSAAATNPSLALSSARDVLWRMSFNTNKHHAIDHPTSSLGSLFFSSPTEKALVSIANRMMSAFYEEVMNVTEKIEKPLPTDGKATPPLSPSFLPHPTSVRVSLRNKEVEALFEQLRQMLRVILTGVSEGPASLVPPSRESSFFKTLLARTVIHSILEMVSLHGALHEAYWPLCLTLLLEFLSLPPPPASPPENKAGIPLWCCQTSSLFLFPIYAQEDTLRCLRRFLRFSGENGVILPFVKALAKNWIGIVTEENVCPLETDEKKPTKNKEWEAPYSAVQAKPNNVEVSVSFWSNGGGKGSNTEMVLRHSSVSTEVFLEFTLDIVVWCCRHSATGKPLLLSFMPWFQQVLLYFKNESIKCRSSYLTPVLTSTAVIVCQALSSGRHDHVLYRGWPVIQNILETFLYPEILQRLAPDEAGSCLSGTSLRGGPPPPESVRKASFKNKGVLLLDNVVAILVKLQQSFHYLIVQIPLDVVAHSAPEFPFLHPLPSSSAGHPTFSNSLLGSSSNPDEFSLPLLPVLSSAVDSYVRLAEKMMNTALMWHTLGWKSSQGHLPRERSLSTSPHRLFLSLLRKLIHCQWDLLYSSFVQQRVLEWCALCSEGNDSDSAMGGQEGSFLSSSTDFSNSTIFKEECQREGSKGDSQSFPLPFTVCGIVDLRSHLRRLLSVEHYYFFPFEAYQKKQRKADSSSASFSSKEPFSLYSVHFQQWCTIMVDTLLCSDVSSAEEKERVSIISVSSSCLIPTSVRTVSAAAAALARDVASVASIAEGLHEDPASRHEESPEATGMHVLNGRPITSSRKHKNRGGEATVGSSSVNATPRKDNATKSKERHLEATAFSMQSSLSSSLQFFLAIIDSFQVYFLEHAAFLGDVNASSWKDSSCRTEGNVSLTFSQSSSASPKKGKLSLLELFSSPPWMLLWLSGYRASRMGNTTAKYCAAWWLSPLLEAGARLLYLLLAEVDFEEGQGREEYLREEVRALPPHPSFTCSDATLSSEARDPFSPSIGVLPALAWPASSAIFYRLIAAAALLLLHSKDPLLSWDSNALTVVPNKKEAPSSRSSFSGSTSSSHGDERSKLAFGTPSTVADVLERLLCGVLQEYLIQSDQWMVYHVPIIAWQTSPVIHVLRLWSSLRKHQCLPLPFASLICTSSPAVGKALMKKEVIRLMFHALSYGFLEEMAELVDPVGEDTKDGSICNADQPIRHEKQELKFFLWDLLAVFPSVTGKPLRDAFFPSQVFSSSSLVSSLRQDDPHWPPQQMEIPLQVRSRATLFRKKGITIFFQDVLRSYAKHKGGVASFSTSTCSTQREPDLHTSLEFPESRTEIPPLSLVRNAVAWLLLCQSEEAQQAVGYERPTSSLVPLRTVGPFFGSSSAPIEPLEKVTLSDEYLFISWMTGTAPLSSGKRERNAVLLSYGEADAGEEEGPLLFSGHVLHQKEETTVSVIRGAPDAKESSPTHASSSLPFWLSPPLLLPPTAKDTLERIWGRPLFSPSVSPPTSAMAAPHPSLVKASWVTPPLYFSAPTLRQLLLVASASRFPSTTPSFIMKIAMETPPETLTGVPSRSRSMDAFPTTPTEERHQVARRTVTAALLGKKKEEKPVVGRSSSSSTNTVKDTQAYCIRWLTEVSRRLLAMETQEVMCEWTTGDSRQCKGGAPRTAEEPMGRTTAFLRTILAFPLCNHQAKQKNAERCASDASQWENSPLDQCSSWSEVLHHAQEKLLPCLLPSSPFLKEEKCIHPQGEAGTVPSSPITLPYVFQEVLCRALMTALQNVLQEPVAESETKKDAHPSDERLVMVSALLLLLESSFCSFSSSPSRECFPVSLPCGNSTLSSFMRCYVLPWLYATREELCKSLDKVLKKNEKEIMKKDGHKKEKSFSCTKCSPSSRSHPLTSEKSNSTQPKIPVFTNGTMPDPMDGKAKLDVEEKSRSNQKGEEKGSPASRDLYYPFLQEGKEVSKMGQEGVHIVSESLYFNTLHMLVRWLLFLSQFVFQVLSPIHFFQLWERSFDTQGGWGSKGPMPVKETACVAVFPPPPLFIPTELSCDAHDVQVAVLRFLLFSLITGETSLISLSGSTNLSVTRLPTSAFIAKVGWDTLKSSIALLWERLREYYRFFTRIHGVSMMGEREEGSTETVGKGRERGIHSSFSLRGWLQSGILLGMWREMLVALPKAEHTYIQCCSVECGSVHPNGTSLLVQATEWDVRLRSLLIAVVLGKSMSRSTTFVLSDNTASPLTLLRKEGRPISEKSSDSVQVGKDGCATTVYDIFKKVFGTPLSASSSTSSISYSSQSCENHRVALVPHPQRWLQMSDQLLRLSQTMEKGIAGVASALVYRCKTPAGLLEEKDSKSKKKGKWSHQENGIAERFEPSSFLCAIDRLCRSQPLHVVAQWARYDVDVPLNRNEEESHSAPPSPPRGAVSSLWWWVGGLVQQKDPNISLALNAVLYDSGKQEKTGVSESTVTRKERKKVEEAWESAIQHLTNGSEEEYAVLRMYESSFGSKGKKGMKRDNAKDTGGGEDGGKATKTEKNKDLMSIMKSEEEIPTICASWATLQAQLSVVPPRRLYLLLLSLASGAPIEEEGEALSCMPVFPIPMFSLSSTSSPPRLPHTVHFISPIWTTAAVGACNTWREIIYLLHASLSTLIRTACKATPVQHLVMQLLFERLRSPASSSSFSQWISSCEFCATMCSTETVVKEREGNRFALQEGGRSRSGRTPVETTATSFLSLALITALRCSRAANDDMSAESMQEDGMPSEVFCSSRRSPPFLLPMVLMSSTVQAFRGLPALVSYCYMYCCGNTAAKPIKVETWRDKCTPAHSAISTSLLPRLPQRLMTEMLRHSVSHPPLCEALYQVFIRQQYKRLEGIHPFLSLLRAAKESLRDHFPRHHKELKSSVHESSYFTVMDDDDVGFDKALSLLVIAMDGYYFSLTGKFLLPSLLKSLHGFSRKENKNPAGNDFEAWLSRLSMQLRWYINEVVMPCPSPCGSLPSFAGVTAISPNGQQTMWKAFVNVSRAVSFIHRSKMSSEINKISSGYICSTTVNPSLEPISGRQKSLRTSSASHSVHFFSRILIVEVVSHFRRGGWVSDVEELMVDVSIPHTEKQGD